MTAKTEQDPTGRAPSEPGAKLDAGKVLAGVLGDFPRALLAVAEVGTFGASKYSRGGWQSVPDGVVRYQDAMWRHLLADRIDPIDADSGLQHAAQVAWNALAALELMLRGDCFHPSAPQSTISPDPLPPAGKTEIGRSGAYEGEIERGDGGGWMSMETAPRDGTEIELIGTATVYSPASWSFGGWGWQGATLVEEKMRGWRPIREGGK